MAKPELSHIMFKDLPLDESLQEALEDNNYVQCTPIQALSLPLLLAGRDVVGSCIRQRKSARPGCQRLSPLAARLRVVSICLSAWLLYLVESF